MAHSERPRRRSYAVLSSNRHPTASTPSKMATATCTLAGCSTLNIWAAAGMYRITKRLTALAAQTVQKTSVRGIRSTASAGSARRSAKMSVWYPASSTMRERARACASPSEGQSHQYIAKLATASMAPETADRITAARGNRGAAGSRGGRFMMSADAGSA